MPFPTPYYSGKTRYWTKERVIDALSAAAKEIRGPLPCCDARWAAVKKGRYDWPPAVRVLEYFGSMARAWLAAGINRKRVSLKNIDWQQWEEELLLDLAGDLTLLQIADRLGRSYGAVRRRLYKLHVKARQNQGWLSAAELAREFNCPYHRVRQLLADGLIYGTFDDKRNSWQVDLAELTDEARELLSAPKQTYTTYPPDVGDYYRRYGLKRTMVDDKLVVVVI